MIDLHTHILPGMDDGSRDPDMSLAMLDMEMAQGVDTVVLTPHFYRQQEAPERFFARRQNALQQLTAAMEARKHPWPRLIQGAEVAWVPNMSQWPELSRFCIGSTGYLLLEMPFYPWNDRILQQLYELMDQGIIPVFAHLERYVKSQKKEYIREILDMGTPVQISSSPLLHLTQRGLPMGMLRRQQAQIVASDCHNTSTRPPNLGSGMEKIRRSLGQDTVRRLLENAEELLRP